ncbi:hypothetical protein M3197_07530 [Sporosarcina aquimarina]|uniref:hypothetical protein n=1 Tax=Sporosarcina aquimarina TaxID=114975 RepID=UPI00203CF3BF|nr:hypothetical protein [Sporosarcina aquimarina]MCM3757339.1 hypothetical protein [Sporosarcina aquimarina]
MKVVWNIIFLLVLVFVTTACSEQSAEKEKGRLVRIDVQHVDEHGNKGEEKILVNHEDLEAAQKAFVNTEWQSKTKADMAGPEDVLATFFYEKDKNMPGSLVQYRIMFEEDDSATITSNNEDESYGRMNPENAQVLKNLFIKN